MSGYLELLIVLKRLAGQIFRALRIPIISYNSIDYMVDTHS